MTKIPKRPKDSASLAKLETDIASGRQADAVSPTKRKEGTLGAAKPKK